MKQLASSCSAHEEEGSWLHELMSGTHWVLSWIKQSSFCDIDLVQGKRDKLIEDVAHVLRDLFAYDAHTVYTGVDKNKRLRASSIIPRHALIFVREDDSNQYTNETERVAVIDICFKEQMSVPRTTDRYAFILNGLPDVFIGSKHDLRKILDFMSWEMECCFMTTGLVFPPWRTVNSLYARWSCDDESIAKIRVRVVTTSAICSPYTHIHGINSISSTSSSSSSSAIPNLVVM